MLSQTMTATEFRLAAGSLFDRMAGARVPCAGGVLCIIGILAILEGENGCIYDGPRWRVLAG